MNKVKQKITVKSDERNAVTVLVTKSNGDVIRLPNVKLAHVTVRVAHMTPKQRKQMVAARKRNPKKNHANK